MKYIISIILLSTNFIINLSFKYIVKSKKQNKNDVIASLHKKSNFNISNYNKLNLRKIYIKSEDNLKLCGYYYTNIKNDNKTIIFVHGYTANHIIGLQFLELFDGLGFNILFIDARCHGNSEGVYSTYGYYEKYDIGRWVKYLKKLNGDNCIIGLMGQSMGASTVLQYIALNKNIPFVIADCPFSNMKDLIIKQFKNSKIPIIPFYYIVRRFILIKCNFSIDDINLCTILKNNQTPTIFIHGSKDELIPYSMSKKMYKSKNCSKDMLCIVKGAEHVSCYNINKKQYTDSVKTFLKAIDIL